ncbi:MULTISPECIES: lipase family protein [Nocardiaceae]|jgi:pimeloyl-ACP methyl ester carboxylesterase|uniref:lipase family protein n=1 Tax=Nocardiaceae TaxID=85025 RepID=UPI00056B47DD|nr:MULTISPECIES: lipase family protein [Rhodococcus]OZF03434.1 lipase [Rhodococcus sp. 15-1189-1-1a]OZF17237.1 lipase [Rhodococcus sp. 14-2686-1-2]OZF54780.1 lipase [Rhodococcus sp. 14-2470-1b]
MRALKLVGAASITAVAIACSVAVGAGTATANPVEPTPISDVFYAPVPDLEAKNPGDIISSRPMPPPAGFFDTDVWQIRFRSTNSAGDPIAAVTTVFSPRNKVPNGPLLSYQHIINALGLQCAPSQALWTQDPNLMIREAPALNVALQRGWTINMADHLGPNSAYGAAKMGGQIVLDSIRATQRFDPLQVQQSPVALAGYSGGGMATAWAAALQNDYAPELNIVGSAAGGAPMNLERMARDLGFNPHPVFGLAFAAAIGLEREYPTRIPISEQLNPLGQQMAAQLQNACTNDIIAVGAGKSAMQVANSIDLIDSPEMVAAVNENSVELYPGVPKAPYFEWHSPTDALIPVSAIDNTVGRYCAAGVPVTEVLVPSNDHLTAAVLGLPQALEWIDARFNGVPAPSNC